MNILTTSTLSGRPKNELQALFAEASKALANSEAARQHNCASLQNISRAISAVHAQNLKL